jgi:hypothetical protein
MKKNEPSWRDRFELLKAEYDKALVELMELKRKYNSLLDKINKIESNE